MKQYVGLDVSQKETSVCVVNEVVKSCSKERPSPTQGRSRHCFASGRHKRSASDLRLGRWRVGYGMNFVGSISRWFASTRGMRTQLYPYA